MVKPGTRYDWGRQKKFLLNNQYGLVRKQTDSRAEIGGIKWPSSFCNKQGLEAQGEPKPAGENNGRAPAKIGGTDSLVSLVTGKHITTCPVLCWGKD